MTPTEAFESGPANTMSDIPETPASGTAAPAADPGAPSAKPGPASAPQMRRRREPAGRSHGESAFDVPRALVALLIVGAVLLAASALDVAVTWGRIHPGVRVGDVAVGFMTPDQARTAVTKAFDASAGRAVTARFGTSSWRITAAEVGAHLDTTASVEAAMAVGRSRGIFAMIGDRLSSYFGGVQVTAGVLGDGDGIDAVLDRIDAAVSVDAKDASVSVVKGAVRFAKAAPGRMLVRDATRRAILGAFLTADRVATVSVTVAGVSVADADARQAYEDAGKLVAGPVRVTYGKQVLDVPRVTVASWVRFDRRPYMVHVVELSRTTPDATIPAGSEPTRSATPQRMVLVASFDPARVGRSISSLTMGLGVPARDASFVASKGKVTVRQSRIGRGADLVSLASDLARACVSVGARSAAVRLTTIQPKLTTDAAREMGISDRISSFTTTYSTANPARVNNVHTLARAFDAKLIAPGGVFSFNQTAGARTAAKGYQEAPAIVDGKLVPQLGGGVCQVGTTFFNTVFFSGLPIIERRNHSFYISHYPKGRDATVSWGGPDFKFKNDTKGWILIRTATTATSLTISLYGTDPGYDVEYTTSPFTDVVPYGTTEEKDPKLDKGARVVEDAGVDGCRVTVVRTVYKDGVVVRKDTFVSHYSPKDEIVRVGTKQASKTATGTASQ